MNKMPIKYNPLVNNVLQLGQRTGHCPAGIFKNIISNVTKTRRQDTDLSTVPSDCLHCLKRKTVPPAIRQTLTKPLITAS